MEGLAALGPESPVESILCMFLSRTLSLRVLALLLPGPSIKWHTWPNDALIKKSLNHIECVRNLKTPQSKPWHPGSLMLPHGHRPLSASGNGSFVHTCQWECRAASPALPVRRVATLLSSEPSSPAIPESANLCHTWTGAVSHESKGRLGGIASSFEALAKAHYLTSSHNCIKWGWL